MRTLRIGLVLIALSLIASITSAQTDFAATMEVLSPTVEVQRVNTANRIAVNVEAIVGVGDTIFTGEEGRARITFFADGTTTELQPNTIYRIEEFEGTEEEFSLRVAVLVGVTTQQLNRALDANSSYEVETPGMTLAARGTNFDIRVEANQRSAMIVRESTVAATAAGNPANVPTGFGVRSETDAPLSDVVRATSFAELDSALDGCTLDVSTEGDVSLNVRISPRLDAQQIGFVAAPSIGTVFGQNESGGWYRIPYAGGFAWFNSPTAEIVGDCAGLRVYQDAFRENPDNYDPDAGQPLLIGG